MSPKMWQLAQEASPLPEKRVASYSKGRPSTTEGGSGLGRRSAATSWRDFRSMTFTASSKRVMHVEQAARLIERAARWGRLR